VTFCYIYPYCAQGVDIYIYTDKDGKTILTNTQIPDEYKAKAQKINSYREPSPAERRGLEKEAAHRYKKILRNAEERKYSVGGKANILCLAEIVKIAETSGKSIQPEFWKLVDSAINGNYSVGGMYNKICEVALIQDIDVSGIAPCQTALYHSKGDGQLAIRNAQMLRQRAEINQLQHQQRMNTFFGK